MREPTNVKAVEEQTGLADRSYAAYSSGEYAEAIEHAKAGLVLEPRSVKLWWLLGSSNLYLERWDAAAAAFAELTTFFPNNPKLFNSIGNLYRANARFDEAIDAYKTALRIQPEHALARKNLGSALMSSGTALREQGKLSAAIATLQESIKVCPDQAEAYFHLGVAFDAEGMAARAVNAWQLAVLLKPDFFEAHSNLGAVLNRLDRYDEAIAACKQALATKPDFVDAYLNLGSPLMNQGKFQEAGDAFRAGLRINPNDARLHYNLANTLNKQGLLDDAIREYKSALAIDPDASEAKWNLSLTYLLLGDYVQGWTFYEQRMYKADRLTRPPLEGKAWHGQALANKRLLVYGEQGIGDIMQFSRYLKMLPDNAAQVVFQIPEILHHFFRRGFPSVTLTENPVDSETVDYECALMSLPKLLGTRHLSDIPSATPYLQADPELEGMWRQRMAGGSFKVGICWQGGTSQVDLGRSFALQHFALLAELSGVELISLHKGAGEQQLSSIDFPVTQFAGIDEGLNAFADTAVIMQCCDLIVTSDTAVAHLAGALHRPTWVALKHLPDWRWLLERNDSPWYPSITLYRQRRQDDWAEVFQRIAGDLRQLIDSDKRVKQ